MGSLGTGVPASCQLGSCEPNFLKLPVTTVLTLLQSPAYSGIHVLEKSITPSDQYYSYLGPLRPGWGNHHKTHKSPITPVSPSVAVGGKQKKGCSCFTRGWNGVRVAVHGPGVWSGMERGVDREPVSVVIATRTATIPPRVCREPAHLPVSSLESDS